MFEEYGHAQIMRTVLDEISSGLARKLVHRNSTVARRVTKVTS